MHNNKLSWTEMWLFYSVQTATHWFIWNKGPPWRYHNFDNFINFVFDYYKIKFSVINFWSQKTRKISDNKISVEALCASISYHYGIWGQNVDSHFPECNLPVESIIPWHWAALYTGRLSLDAEWLLIKSKIESWSTCQTFLSYADNWKR